MLPESGEEKYNLRRDDKIYRKRVNKFIKNLYGGKERNSKRDKKICGKIRIYDSRKKKRFSRFMLPYTRTKCIYEVLIENRKKFCTSLQFLSFFKKYQEKEKHC